MFSYLQAASRKTAQLTLRGLQLWPFWGITLLIVSMLYKLNELNDQLNVGSMNHWKWAVNLGAVLLASFWTLLLGLRARAVSLAILNLLLSFLLFADLVYFRYFKDFISVPVLLQAGQVGKLQESIWSLIYMKDWILFADLPIAIAIVVWVFRITRDRDNRSHSSRKLKWRKSISAVILFTLGFALIYFPVEEQKNGWARGLFVGNWWNVPIYNVTGLLGFHGYDTYRYAKNNWFSKGISDEQMQEAEDWFVERRKLQAQMENEPLFGTYKGKNVLIVQAEAFQEFVIGQYIGGQEITPHLNELMGRSIYFPNFYHQTAQGRTSDADFATSCSMHPLPTGSVFIRYAGNEFNCAPSILNDQGYDTTVHHSYDGSFWNRNNMYHNMQYDQFYNLKDFKVDEPIGWSLGDQSFFRQTVQQLKDRNQSPFYALTITLSSHHPFKLPFSKQELDVGDLQGTIMGDYLQATHYVDSSIGVLIQELKDEGLWDDTILLFYGDHDNSITNWSLYEQLYGYPVSELEKDRIIRNVPFFIHLPQDEYSGENLKAVGQIDITPTIMHLLGIPVENRFLMGISMLSATPKSVVFRNGGFTDDEVYFVPSADGIVRNGACYQMPDGERLDDSTACTPGAEAAKHDLSISDRVIENNLVSKLREEEEQ